MIEEIDYSGDSFEDILAKDNRYAANAYAFLMDVLHCLFAGSEHVSGEQILDEFKVSALDQFGPLSFTVLSEWGIHGCEDIGEMMFNLSECNRVNREAGDSPEAFVCGYDFKETFLEPYNP